MFLSFFLFCQYVIVCESAMYVCQDVCLVFFSFFVFFLRVHKSVCKKM